MRKWRTAVLALVGAVLTLGCGREPVYQGKPASHWIEQLRDKDFTVRIQAVRALQAIGPEAKAAYSPLVEILKNDPSAEIRQAAGAALATIAPQSNEAKEHLNRDNEELTRTLVNESVPNAIEIYKLHTKQYPMSLGDLLSNNSGAEGWSGPYLRTSQVKDGWGTELQYQLTKSGYTLYSLGKDRVKSGDDIHKDGDNQ